MINSRITFEDVGVEVLLIESDDFLKVRETLTRIGIASRKEKKLFQSCHILHKQGRYKILHFKELFSLDGRKTNFSKDDLGRRNTIVNLLADWGLIKRKAPPVPPNDFMVSIGQIKILPFKEKNDWQLIPKYEINKSQNSKTI